MPERNFPPPWSVGELDSCFVSSEPCAVRRWTHFTGNHYRACEEAECGGDYSWKSGVFVPIGILFPNRVAYHLYYLHLLHRNGECQNEARLN